MTQKKILVVDDEPYIVEMMTTFLTLKGYDVRGAYTGEGGLAMVRAEKPDAVLLDLMLPDIEGFEVCQRLRESDEFANLPVLIISARTDSASKARAENAGANAYFTKPIAMPRLIAELEQRLAQADAERSNPSGTGSAPDTAPPGSPTSPAT